MGDVLSSLPLSYYKEVLSVPQYKELGVKEVLGGETAVAVTPNNSTDLATFPTRGIYVGVSGNIKVDMAGTGTAIILKNLAAGVVHPLAVKRVYSTDTTATDIVAVY